MVSCRLVKLAIIGDIMLRDFILEGRYCTFPGIGFLLLNAVCCLFVLWSGILFTADRFYSANSARVLCSVYWAHVTSWESQL